MGFLQMSGDIGGGDKNSRTNTESVLLINVHTSVRFPQFSHDVLFLYQDPIQDSTLYLVVKSPLGPQSWDSFSHFPQF